MTNDIKVVIEELLFYAGKNLDMYEEDYILRRNNLLDLLKVDAPADAPVDNCRPLQEILDDVNEYAAEHHLAEEWEKINFETRVMGLLMPMPFQVITTFEQLAASDPALATKYLYNLSVNSNYIRKVDIDKNIGWKVANPRGDIMITINLSKPEKDPKAILAAKNAPQTAYPKCMLCKECVGFSGNAARPARQTLRTIPIILNNEVWHFQFSPYVYFENHCIALSDEHRPMHIDADTFERMFDFVELFPDYFIGSNADLPIVGGSILSHDHYQGGSKVLPEMSAPSKKFFTHSSFENVKVSIVDWYNSVIRLEGKDRKEVRELAAHILKCWREYSDKNVDISAKTRNEPHNTVTPIARFNDENHYVIDMILRNNRTDKAHPFGIFHPTEDLHNIKKEGIGIIEALGLFILPGRLASEAHGIRDILTGKTPLDFKTLSDESNPLSKHIGMIAQLANDFGTSLTDEEAATRVTDYINDACVRILDCTAVFKHDEKGEQAFDRFMTYCGF